MWRKPFFRPTFHFNDPFEEDPFFFPIWDRPLALAEEEAVPRNALDTFNEFFNQHKIEEHEKPFFEKNFPEKVQKEFNPYETLGVSKDATLNDIKKAYREQALKVHPKSDQSEEASKRFDELGKAYDMLVNRRYIDNYKKNSIHDFFDNFEKSIKPSEMEEEGKDKAWKDADFYSESTYVESKNGKDKKVNFERQYNKNGKIVKVKREEKFLPDGTKEVFE